MMVDGKTALVTGGAGAAGAGIARALSASGARVCIADPNLDAARALAAEIGGTGLPLDPLDDASFASLAYAVGDAWGDLDILVNAVGATQVSRPLDETPVSDFDRNIALHARPIFLATRHFIPPMKARRAGVVLNIAAISGVYQKSRLGWQGASKAWIAAATEAMAAEFAEHGLRVNALVPVIDDSPAVPSFMGGAKSAARQQALTAIPLGRFASPGDIGQAAVFLCSDAAAYLTGVVLPVDGGRRL